MKKIFSLIAFLFVALTTFSQGGIQGDGRLAPTGAYPIIKFGEGQTGYWPLTRLTQRDSIPLWQRTYGMVVKVKDTDSCYELKSLTLDNSNWLAFKQGSVDLSAYATNARVNDSLAQVQIRIQNKSPLAGSTAVTIVGTVVTGTWSATPIADAYISSAASWNAKQNALGYTAENTANKGVANGYADLDALGKVPASRLDFGQIGQTFVVASQSSMLAVSNANVGALAIRTDNNRNYRLIATPASTLANWQILAEPDAPVQSVNGQTGNVNLLTTNISEGSNLWFTIARVRASISITNIGNSGTPTYDNTTGVFNIPAYTLAGLGGVPTSRTINGFDLSANRTFTTSDVAEGSNLYWTNARGDARYTLQNGTNANGTWSISITGTAGGVAWTNVSSRPTFLSQFTNDLGTIANSTTGNAATATLAANSTLWNSQPYSGDYTSGSILGLLAYQSSGTAGWKYIPMTNVNSILSTVFLPLTGGTLTGNLTVGNGSADTRINSNSSQPYGIGFTRSAGSTAVYLGTNSGGDLILSNNAGTQVGLWSQSGNITANSGNVIIGNDGTYTNTYSSLSFGGNTNGSNRIFGSNTNADGIFIAAATGRGIGMRVNGGTTDNLLIESSGAIKATNTFEASGIILSQAGYQFKWGGTNRGGIYARSTWTGGATNYSTVIGVETGFGIDLFVDGSAAKGLSIASTGALNATSNITAAGYIFSKIGASNTIGDGSLFTWDNAGSGGSLRQTGLQMNASFGLDLWHYNGTDWGNTGIKFGVDGLITSASIKTGSSGAITFGALNPNGVFSASTYSLPITINGVTKYIQLFNSTN